ncbi:MAG: hypothetical protein RRY16_00225 [Bacilli bacterium]
MKKALFLILLLILPLKAEALFCDYSKLASIRKETSNVNVMTSYELKENVITYYVTIYNLKENLYVIDKTTGKTYNYGNNSNNPSEITIMIAKGGTYRFDVYSKLNDCNDSPLSSLYAELPVYNKYYSDSLCNDVREYKLCQKWFSTSLSYDVFKKNIIDYKKSKEVIVDEDKDDNYKNFYDYILEFYIKYYYYILPTIIVIGVVSIVIVKKKENKFNL